MKDSRNKLQFAEIEKVKVSFLDYAKKVLFNEVEKVKISKNESILLMYEEGRISREEYVMLISSPENTIINLTIDHSINANGGTWGGRIIMGDNHGGRY